MNIIQLLTSPDGVWAVFWVSVSALSVAEFKSLLRPQIHQDWFVESD
jgi:hypothetical protein